MEKGTRDKEKRIERRDEEKGNQRDKDSERK